MTSDLGPQPRSSAGTEWVTVAVLTRVRGNRGELAAISLSSHTERFQKLREVSAFRPDGSPVSDRPLTLEEVWEHGSRLIFKFQGIDSISEAEALCGAELRIPAEKREVLPKGEYYVSDLIGCRVVDGKTGRLIGRVAKWLDQAGAGVLEVDDEEQAGELLIPFARSICVEIDVQASKIVVELPEGLREVNRR